MPPQAAEILVALKKLGEPLAPKEEKFLAQQKSAALSDLEAIEGDLDTVKSLPGQQHVSSSGGSSSG